MKIRSTLVTVAVAAVVMAVALAAPAGARRYASPASSCSAQGLRFTYSSAGATFSVKVTQLKVTAVTCRASRTLAAEVAKDLLHSRKVPARISGLRVLVKKPCAGCSPDVRVKATGTRRPNGVVPKVTFDVLGGA